MKIIQKIELYWWNIQKRKKVWKEFIETCKKEQSYTRSHRPEYMKFDVYDLQEGMLPENYLEMKPKVTGKHFNDYAWPKTNKK